MIGKRLSESSVEMAYIMLPEDANAGAMSVGVRL